MDWVRPFDPIDCVEASLSNQGFDSGRDARGVHLYEKTRTLIRSEQELVPRK